MGSLLHQNERSGKRGRGRETRKVPKELECAFQTLYTSSLERTERKTLIKMSSSEQRGEKFTSSMVGHWKREKRGHKKKKKKTQHPKKKKT